MQPLITVEFTGTGKSKKAIVTGEASIISGVRKNPYTHERYCDTSGAAAPLSAVYQKINNQGGYVWHQWSGVSEGDGSCEIIPCTLGDGTPGYYGIMEQVMKQQISLAGFYEFRYRTYCLADPCDPPCPEPTFEVLKVHIPPEWDPPCENNDLTGSSILGGAVHEPTGYYYLPSEPDLTLKSPFGDLSLKRTYRTSLLGVNEASGGMFGQGWRFNFEHQILDLVNGYGLNYGLTLIDGRGQRNYYIRRHSSRTFHNYFDSRNGDGSYIELKADGTYTLYKRDGTVYDFNSAGRLSSITDIHDNQTAMIYSGDRISSIVDPLGREVSFGYGGDLVQTITGPNGTAATFTYDGIGNLTQVSYPDSSSTHYEYADPDFPSHITAVRAAKGGNDEYLKTVQYDDHGRVETISESPWGKSYKLEYDNYDTVDLFEEYPSMGQVNYEYTLVT